MVKLLKILAASILGCTVVLMSAQVVLRYIFNAPQAWAEEVGRYLFIWAVFLGAAAAMADDRHIRITVITGRLGRRADAISRMAARVVNILSFSVVLYYGYKLVYINWGAKFYTIRWMPQVFYYLAAPIGLTLMVIFIVYDLYSTLKK